MDDMKTHWGRYYIWGAHISAAVHPDDLRQAMEAIGTVFDGGTSSSTEGKVLGDITQCEAADGEYVTVRLSEGNCRRVRIKREEFHKLPAPPVVYGDRVRVTSKGKVVDATVERLCWHFKKSEYYFYVSVDGKRLKRQYWQEEFLDAKE